LRDCERNTDTDQLLKTRDVGDEVSVEIIAIESAPESSIGGLAEEVVENVEFLDGFGEGRVACCWESGGCGDWGEDVWREEVESEGEVGGGEEGERLDKDVGDYFVFCEMGIELISAEASVSGLCNASGKISDVIGMSFR
jgi:hypothetical protein